MEIQHDLRFLLHFDPPELNWVAHRGLWLDFRTLVVVFDECVVWEGATSSGRERPMFVAFEALRGGCLSVCLSDYPSICPSIHVAVCLSMHLSVCPSIHPSICLCSLSSVRLSVYPSVYLSFCLSIYPSIHPSVHVACPASVCLSFCLSIYPSIHPSIHPSM